MKKYALAAGVLVAILGLSWLFFHRSIKKFLRGPQEISSGRFQDPEGLAVDSAGRIYVSDEDRGTLTVLSPDGETLKTLKHDFIHGDSLVTLKLGVVVTIGDHELWMLDTLNEVKPVVGRIEVSTPAGIVDPEGIAQSPASGEIFVTLEDVRKVKVFTSGFKPVTE